MKWCAHLLVVLVLVSSVSADDPAAWRAQVEHGMHVMADDTPVDDSQTLEMPRTLEALQQLAATRHPAIRVAAAGADAARGTSRQARLWPNPILAYNGDEIGNRGTPGMQGGFLRQRVVTAGKLGLSGDVADRRVLAAEHLVVSARQRVLNDVKVRFYDTLVAQQRVALTSQLVRLGDELATATAKLVAGNQASTNSLLQTEIAAEQARAIKENADNQLVEAWRLLRMSVGLPGAMEAGLGGLQKLEGRVTADLPDMSWQECRDRILASHPELLAARERVAAASISVTRQQRQVIPDLDVRVGRARMYVTDSDVTSVMVGVSLPIFDRNQGGIARSEAELLAARFDVDRLELQLRQRAATAYREYANTRQQARRYSETILPRARKSIGLVRKGYGKGQIGVVELLVAQQKYVEVNLAYLATIRQLRESVTVIESQLLSGGLHGHRRAAAR